MFAYLRGKITEKNLDNANFSIEVNNIGYSINTNLKFLNSFYLNDESKVYISYLVKETGHYLYGFPDKASRDIFEILTSVSGVGPKAAMSILNILSLEEIISAVLKDNHKIIAEAQGIGPKTAKRIILELTNKLNKYSREVQLNDEQQAYKHSEDVSTVLANLGFSALEIDKSLKTAKSENIEDDSELLVKFCLQNLSLQN